MSSWEDVVKKDSPREAEIRLQREQEKAHNEQYKLYVVDSTKWDLLIKYTEQPWNYERQRLYKYLGIKMVSKDQATYTRSEGPLQLSPTYSGAYEIKRTTNVEITYNCMLEVDKSKIYDMEKYTELKRRVDDFLWEAKNKFGSPIVGEKPVAPTYFNEKDVFNFKFRESYEKDNVLGKMISLPIYRFIAKQISKNYIKKHREYIPLVKAYFEQVKAFKREIRQITCFE